MSDMRIPGGGGEIPKDFNVGKAEGGQQEVAQAALSKAEKMEQNIGVGSYVQNIDVSPDKMKQAMNALKDATAEMQSRISKGGKDLPGNIKP